MPAYVIVRDTEAEALREPNASPRSTPIRPGRRRSSSSGRTRSCRWSSPAANTPWAPAVSARTSSAPRSRSPSASALMATQASHCCSSRPPRCERSSSASPNRSSRSCRSRRSRASHEPRTGDGPAATRHSVGQPPRPVDHQRAPGRSRGRDRPPPGGRRARHPARASRPRPGARRDRRSGHGCCRHRTVYRGSYTGVFRLFFDLLPQDALAGTPVLLTAGGGDDQHALAIDHQLRPMFAFFRARVLPVGVYARAGDYTRDKRIDPTGILPPASRRPWHPPCRGCRGDRAAGQAATRMTPRRASPR